MVRHMSEGQVARQKERAVADMRMNKRTYIRESPTHTWFHARL
jgi:hypothetical protein